MKLQALRDVSASCPKPHSQGFLIFLFSFFNPLPISCGTPNLWGFRRTMIGHLLSLSLLGTKVNVLGTMFSLFIWGSWDSERLRYDYPWLRVPKSEEWVQPEEPQSMITASPWGQLAWDPSQPWPPPKLFYNVVTHSVSSTNSKIFHDVQNLESHGERLTAQVLPSSETSLSSPVWLQGTENPTQSSLKEKGIYGPNFLISSGLCQPCILLDPRAHISLAASVSSLGSKGCGEKSLITTQVVELILLDWLQIEDPKPRWRWDDRQPRKELKEER